VSRGLRFRYVRWRERRAWANYRKWQLRLADLLKDESEALTRARARVGGGRADWRTGESPPAQPVMPRGVLAASSTERFGRVGDGKD